MFWCFKAGFHLNGEIRWKLQPRKGGDRFYFQGFALLTVSYHILTFEPSD